jgi:hemin uptake protein HemP
MTGHCRPSAPATGQVTAERDRPQAARREYGSAELFGNDREIHIRHADGLYTLRQTAKGKLILTK